MWAKQLAGLGVAVALVASLTTATVEQPRAEAKSPAPTFTTVFRDNFNGDSIDPTYWSPRGVDGSILGTRYCAVSNAANSTVANGVFSATVTKAPADQAAAMIASAKAAQKKDKKKTVGCPYGTYEYSMVGTDWKVSVQYGQLTARVKFATGQGFHGGVWLRSVNPDLEIDMIETYGYGYGGVTNFFYKGTKRYPSKSKKLLTKQVKKKSWWKAWHTVRVQWVPSTTKGKVAITYYMDGKVTSKLNVKAPAGNYTVVMSNIVSTWETPLFKKPKKKAKGVKKAVLPQSMQVDWIQLDQLNQ